MIIWFLLAVVPALVVISFKNQSKMKRKRISPLYFTKDMKAMREDELIKIICDGDKPVKVRKMAESILEEKYIRGIVRTKSKKSS